MKHATLLLDCSTTLVDTLVEAKGQYKSLDLRFLVVWSKTREEKKLVPTIFEESVESATFY